MPHLTLRSITLPQLLTLLVSSIVMIHAYTPVKDVVLRAVTIHQPPFVFINQNASQQLERFYGFAIDLMQEVTSHMQNVTIEYQVEDGTFGTVLPNGTWNGMIGDLMSNRAHLIGPVAVSALRYNAISFTPSYFDTGLSLLVNKEDDRDNPFSFLLPFSWEVWILLLVSMCVVSILSWLFDFYSPYGYRKGAQDVDSLSFSSSLFNSAATLTGQGGEIGRSWSTRVLLVGYCVFAMIALSTYTANLAAFLTTKIQANRFEFGRSTNVWLQIWSSQRF